MLEANTETSFETGRVLIADDQQHILDALQMLLGGCGFSTEVVTHPGRVLRALETGKFDAVVMDLNYTRDTTSGGEGLELVSRIRAMDSLLPVVVMTAWSSVDLAVEAMRRGASDFIQKPWENQELLEKLQHQLSWARSKRQAQRQRDEELREAREIQAGLLPKKLPPVAGCEVAAMTQPLKFVGGDYYNLVRLSERHTAICIADVAGKGMPAALLMSSLQAALTPLIAQRLAPGELCHRLNRILCDVMPVGKFITFFYAVLDSAENRLTYCNAGHNPPLIIRADGSSMGLSAGGAVLGQFPQWCYEQGELQMKSGDRLILFTDGLVEASNPNGEMFGEESLIRVAQENSDCSAEELIRLLIGAASRHSERQFQDDVSLIVLETAARAEKSVASPDSDDADQEGAAWS